MRTSIFTPTNSGRYLYDAYRSLAAQTHQDFEWVLVANGPFEIPDAAARDDRVTVVRVPPLEAAPGIGYLKRLACSKCTGDLLVEFDHDDLLVPMALERLLHWAGRSKAGFFYSDCAQFFPDGRSHVLDERMGWEHYPIEFEGSRHTAVKSFPLSPAMLCRLEWAPNHVRAWTREAYEKAGGHDATMPVADDHDLVCRTYLAGVDFFDIPECLYLYREHNDATGKNTYRAHPQLQRLRQVTHERHKYRIVEEWCRRKGLLKVDLGAAFGKPPGFTGVDLRPLPGVDVVHDVRKGFPFPDDSVGFLRASDFLEHLAPGREIIDFWNEAYRVLAPGGWFVSHTPSTDGRGAWQDPTHLSGWNENSFLYATHRDQQQYVDGLHARFQAINVRTGYPSTWHEQHKVTYVDADLCALKGQRQPGPCHI